jgi:REP element-mobilizing transposase RayT
MCLDAAGEMVAALWHGLPGRFQGVEIDRYVVMPNHLHDILVLPDGDSGGATLDGATTERATTRVAPTGILGEPHVGAPAANTEPVGAPLVGARVRLGDVVGALKSLATVGYIAGVKDEGWPQFHGRLWQRNYSEHVIRDEAALDRIRRYVDDNPARWEFDDENPHKAR